MQAPHFARTVAVVMVMGAAWLGHVAAQQRNDPSFDASVAKPSFPADRGPIVAVDAGHHNFHTISGRYRTFADVLTSDGYRVRQQTGEFTDGALAEVSILVIANAGTDSVSNWKLPTHSAFTPAEVDVVERWVRKGGALLMMVDHMPAAGSTALLGERFGVRFSNGYTLAGGRTSGTSGDLFTRRDSTLLDHPLIRGRNAAERIDTVVTFTGQAFQVMGSEVTTLLRFGDDAVTLLPVEAGLAFDSLTPRVASPRWPHAVTVVVGSGRVAIFGEAAMFSAQLAGPDRRPMGMNNPRARRNKQLLLNTAHWLSRLY